MTFRVEHGGYPFSVFVSVGANDDPLLRRLEKSVDLTSGDREALVASSDKGHTVMLSSGYTVIRLERFDGSPNDHAILSHEVFHAVTLLMVEIGITLDDKSDEAFAYAIQSLTKQILEKLAVKSKTKKAVKPKSTRRMK